MVCILVVRVSREILPVGYLKGRYKSESSLMTCVAELHGSVTRMPSSILSLIVNHEGDPDDNPAVDDEAINANSDPPLIQESNSDDEDDQSSSDNDVDTSSPYNPLPPPAPPAPIDLIPVDAWSMYDQLRHEARRAVQASAFERLAVQQPPPPSPDRLRPPLAPFVPHPHLHGKTRCEQTGTLDPDIC